MRLYEFQDPKLKKIHQFALWAIEKLGIKGEPKLNYSNDKAIVDRNRSFGSTKPSGQIWVFIGDRNTADAMRTLCHELVHYRQFEKGIPMPNNEQDRYKIEDQANAIAGRMMRAYGLEHQDIYEWKFKKSRLTEDEFSRSYHKIWTREKETNNKLPFRPAPIIAGYLMRVQENRLWEHQDIDDLKEFQTSLKTYDQRKYVSLEPGNQVSILQFEPHTNSGVIEVKGFLYPKEIKNIIYDRTGDVDWIEFIDGSTFPDSEFLTHNKGGGDWEGLSTLFFPNYRESSKTLKYLVFDKLKLGNWKISTINLDRKKHINTMSEGRTGSIQPDVSRALPATYLITSLPNQDPYLQYRFTVAIANAKGKKAREGDDIPPFQRVNPWGRDELVVSFDPHIKDWIDEALAEMNYPASTAKQVTTTHSQEMPDVYYKSPVQAFKGYGKKEK